MPFKETQIASIAVAGGVAWLVRSLSTLWSPRKRKDPSRVCSPLRLPDADGASQTVDIGGGGIIGPAAVANEPPERANSTSHQPDAPDDIPDGIPHGLVNTGNTCFLNCVLQCLASLRTFQSYVVQTAAEERRLEHGNGFAPRLAACLKLLASRTQTAQTYQPSSLQQHLLVGDLSRVGQQHDAHELFLAVMVALHATTGECLRGWKHHETAVPHGAAPRESQEWPMLGGHTAAVLENPFGCLMQSKVRCHACGRVGTIHNEYFLDLTLKLPYDAPRAPLSLASCLRNSFASESVKMRCERCDSRQPEPKLRGIDRQHSKDYKMRRAPRVLCLHLDRIAAVGSVKRTEFVQFPLLLDMAPYLGGMEQEDDLGFSLRPTTYRLSGLVQHHGVSVSNGHYTAFRSFVGSDQTESWYHISDTFVQKVSIGDVLKSQAYMLYYAICE